MYEFDNTKRYNVKVTRPDGYHLTLGHFGLNVELIMLAPNFVAFRDNKGKEHIFTGSVCIEIEEA